MPVRTCRGSSPKWSSISRQRNSPNSARLSQRASRASKDASRQSYSSREVQRLADRADDRCGVPLAQAPLGVGVLARPPVGRREPVRVEVPGDQVGARLGHVRGARGEPLPDLLELGGELALGDRLALLPLAVLLPDRPPPAAFLPGRVDGDPEVQLDDFPVAPGGGAGLGTSHPAGRPRLAAPGCAAGALRARPGLPRDGCGDCVGILKTAAAACVIFLPRFLHSCR
jgi:hypothetical protein